jgi:hypothetical protein
MSKCKIYCFEIEVFGNEYGVRSNSKIILPSKVSIKGLGKKGNL